MIKESVTIDEMVTFLNEFLSLDPQATSEFLNRRILVNDLVVNHPTIQCRVKDNQGSINLIGLLNGLFGIDEKGYGALCYVIEEADRETILRFQRYKREN